MLYRESPSQIKPKLKKKNYQYNPDENLPTIIQIISPLETFSAYNGNVAEI